MVWSLYFSVNITVGASEERLMLSGMHTVADIFCCSCGQIVGWKYVSLSLSLSLACLHTYIVLNTYTHLYFGKDRANFLFVFLIIPLQESAREKSQKYKEGKFVLERYMRYVSLLYIQIPFFFWLGGWHPAGSFIYTVTICVSIYNRGRIVDEIDFSTEVYIDTRPSVSDAEE